MAKKEVLTDFWVHGLLKEAGINLDPQGSSILEINSALKTASKNGSGNVGFPEFVGVIKDFLLVIENKPELSKHIKLPAVASFVCLDWLLWVGSTQSVI